MENTPVQNLRKSVIPGWLIAVLSLCLGFAVAVVPVIVTMARMPDGTRFDQVRDDVAAIKQKIAVMEAKQEGKANLDDLRNKVTDSKLDQLLTKKK